MQIIIKLLNLRLKEVKIFPMNLKSKLSVFVLLLVILSYNCCNDDGGKDDPAHVKMEFPGIVFTDEYGNTMGTRTPV
jgi:hypothetical protein